MTYNIQLINKHSKAKYEKSIAIITVKIVGICNWSYILNKYKTKAKLYVQYV